MNEPIRSVHLIIRGRVQGVGFRAWVEYAVLARGLEGWVRNRSDGTVEAVFHGPEEDVISMIDACRHGPRNARVDAIEERHATARDLAERHPGELFSLLPTR